MSDWGVLLSPAILFFVLGVLAALVKSDLSIPESIAKGLSLYLMASIGIKGGAQVAASGYSIEFLVTAIAGVVLSFSIPLLVYFLLRRVGALDPVNAAATAAHYGSVSVVTFATGVDVLSSQGLPPAGYMVAVLALMETPAIVVGLMLARGSASTILPTRAKLAHEALFNGSVVLLIGSFLIGLLLGKEGVAPISPVFETAFRGALCFFLLDMGLVAARRIQEARNLTHRLIWMAIALPILNGTMGVVIGTLINLDAGSAAALGILAGSASYIAVPAVMRLTLPQADPGIYLGMSLGVTFPFNIVLGIPFYTYLSTKMVAL